MRIILYFSPFLKIHLKVGYDLTFIQRKKNYARHAFPICCKDICKENRISV